MSNYKTINEILLRYGDLHDALVTEVKYKRSINETGVEVQIRCRNLLKKEYKWELVLFSFIDVSYFRLIENNRVNSTVILNALFTTEGKLIVADFQAANVGPDMLEIDADSTFIIKSEKIKFQVIETLSDY